MRRTTGFVALIVTALLATGCSKKKQQAPEEPAETPAAPAAAATPPPVPPAAQPAQPKAPTMVNNAGNCPSAAPGAQTTIDMSESAVVVTIHGSSDESVAEIRKRAAHLGQVQHEASDTIKHTGEGTGGGDLGICPVVTVDTSITVEDSDKGVTITLAPSDGDTAKLAELESTAEQRLQALTRQRFGATDKEPATEHEHGEGGGRGMGGGAGGGGSQGAGLNQDNSAGKAPR